MFLVPLILWGWLGTFVISYSIDIFVAVKSYKEMARQGYKININRAKDLVNLNEDKVKEITFYNFLPGGNIKLSLDKAKDYKNDFESVMDGFRITRVIVEMSEEEFKDYKSNPTFRNLIDISTGLSALKIKENNIPEEIEKLKLLREKLLKYKEQDETKITERKLKIIERNLKYYEEIIEEQQEEQKNNQDLEDGPKLKKRL